MKIVPDAVEPRWWQNGENFEAYGFIKKNRAIINVLDHAPNARSVKVDVDTSKLGLNPGRPIFATLLLMNDPVSLQPDTADPNKTVRVFSNDEAFTRKLLLSGIKCPALLKLDLPTRPGLLTSVILSHEAANEK